jgi:hypothetical protein
MSSETSALKPVPSVLSSLKLIDSPILYFDKIKYWRLPEESDGDAYDYPQRHAADIRVVYKAIKNVNPNVKLFSAGTFGSAISYSNTPFD